MTSEFENISPYELTRFVSFYREAAKHGLTYDKYTAGSMQQKQADGASYIFNLLNEKGIALLADEVGMGKTIQSLAVCAALWQQKPDAQILILAPRYEIANNWIDEYETFIKVHYKVRDQKVKARNSEPVNPPYYCDNLYELVKGISEKRHKLFIGKISSFSSLLSQSKTEDRLIKLGIEPAMEYDDERLDKIPKVRSIAKQLRRKAKENLVGSQFDLIIIDEAHYLRNASGGSLKVNAAKKFFGKNGKKLGKRTLMLTATPNHSSSDNIRSIVSYFDDGHYANSSFKQILEDICLRRFRRLSQKGKIKYNYRQELPRGSDFKGDTLSELFFGIYQKQLANEYLKSETGRRTNILGFLEGMEFIPKDRSKEEEDKNDFANGSDSEMLLRLGEKYQKTFNSYPAHPKYNQLVEDLIPTDFKLDCLNDKKLVFVRRIPSVREIASRVIHRYDEILVKKLNEALPSKPYLNINNGNFRKHFQYVIKKHLGSYKEEEDPSNEGEQNENDSIPLEEGIPNSLILDLFKIIKNPAPSTPKATNASKFRIRFNRKESIFMLFFSPGANYFNEPYTVDSRIYVKKGLSVSDAQKYRLLQANVSQADLWLLTNSIDYSYPEQFTLPANKNARSEIPTLLTLYWDYLDRNNHKLKDSIRETYGSFSIVQREAFSKFIAKGILFASTIIVDLYCAYLKTIIPSSQQGVQLYSRFIKQVAKTLDNSPLVDCITSGIFNFKVMAEKVFKLNDAKSYYAEKWEDFNNANPAFPYSARTKNSRVMNTFNTPFFPEILVSTSVLQEGVNLQYFCDTIIHYGIAWTPGDNEQRVGRIDRMYGKIESRLESDENSRLNIFYPYLKNTIDQDHVANFIRKKYSEENLIDKCSSEGSREVLNPETITDDGWLDYFRQPDNLNASDPFEVDFSRLNNPTFVFIEPKLGNEHLI